ncbi:hypothetical protein HWV62_37535 [Athelia sp. TMB]|nr:hypothetical protein HWV62_37535 [Athelia sp. TMB]
MANAVPNPNVYVGPHPQPPTFGRIVVLDAGSSGTRFYGYQWVEDGLAPKVTQVYEGPKADGALESNYQQDPITHQWPTREALKRGLKVYLDGIFDPAVGPPTVPRPGEQVKENLLQSFKMTDVVQLKQVPIFIMGTAGMRVYADKFSDQHQILKEEIDLYVHQRGEYKEGRQRTSGGPYEYYSTIKGEDEAAFGWVAANFLLGAFTSEYKTNAQDTVGYLEMGGQSAQIAFRPFVDELTPDKLHDGDITRVKLGEQEFDLVLKTWDLGSNQAWREYQNDLVITKPENDAGEVVHDPDSPYARRWRYDQPAESAANHHAQPWEIRGSGEFDPERFHKKVLKVLDRLSQPAPARGTRLLDENLLAALKARRFVGGANFWYSTRGVFGRNVDVDGTAKTTMFSFEEYWAEKLIDAMRAKAVRQEELLWDYITMAATFEIRAEVPGNLERVKRMVGLAEVAAQTSRALRREAMVQESQEANLRVMRAQHEGNKDLALMAELTRDSSAKAAEARATASTTAVAPGSGERLTAEVLKRATKAINALGENDTNYWVALIGLDADIEEEDQPDALARLRKKKKELKPAESKEEIKNLLWHVKKAAGNPLPGPAPAAIND